MARILIADDNPNVLEHLRRVLERSNLGEIVPVGNGPQALEQLCASHFDLAILDIYMPGLDGLEVLRQARKKHLSTPIVILTGQSSVETAVQALRTGAQDYLEKPIKNAELIATVYRLLEEHPPSPNFLAGRLDQLLKEHATQPSLRLKDLCTHFHISSSYAGRLFEKHVGTSFRQCLAQYRVTQAKHLLTTTDLPLYMVAEQCGFKNQRRLTETFSRMEGMPPRKYREKYRPVQ